MVVRELLLSENSICAISSSLFQDLKQIRLLDLSDNKICDIYDLFAPFINLLTYLQTTEYSAEKHKLPG